MIEQTCKTSTFKDVTNIHRTHGSSCLDQSFLSRWDYLYLPLPWDLLKMGSEKTNFQEFPFFGCWGFGGNPNGIEDTQLTVLGNHQRCQDLNHSCSHSDTAACTRSLVPGVSINDQDSPPARASVGSWQLHSRHGHLIDFLLLYLAPLTAHPWKLVSHCKGDIFQYNSGFRISCCLLNQGRLLWNIEDDESQEETMCSAHEEKQLPFLSQYSTFDRE